MRKRKNKSAREKKVVRKKQNLKRMQKTVETPADLNMEEEAKKLADEIAEAHPSVEGIFWFPDSSELRILEIDPTTLKSPTPTVEPFYFDSTASLPTPSGVAIIHPDEYGKLNLPKEWGDWRGAKKLKGKDTK